ncbi:AAA family ATPase [Bdellovibrio bacteriovorus]|uniref:AAA family ATPase n=1 Tax=Bdellovibrio bacteriovorus TaxID=959 RepID=UPI0035A5BF8C
MKLKRARVTKFRSIDDSTWVDAENVLALVGKNESGKTTFIQALEKLNPVEASRGNFDPVKDYPRREYTKYKKEHEANPATVVKAEFELTQEEISEIEKEFGVSSLKKNTVTVEKNYANKRTWIVDLNEGKILAHLFSEKSLPSEVKDIGKTAKSLEAAIESLEKLTDRTPATTELLENLKKNYSDCSHRVINEYLVKFIPKFVYFGDYSVLKGTVNVQNLSQKLSNNPSTLTDSDRTFLALLANAGTELSEFQNNQKYEPLKAELEAASASISDEVFEYWSQNKHLRVEFDISPGHSGEVPPFNQGTNLHVRIWNDRHRVSVPFDERSRGFVWFFSFLAYFSQLDGTSGSLILLLDEPALNLHGTAQTDFLRFIDERLAPKYQVLFTTHSPSLVPSKNWERVRTVQDLDGIGTVISKDIFKCDSETLFPLQAALGYEITQSLFIGPNILLVEGPSDLLYLQALGNALRAKGQSGIDARWTVTPCGGVDRVGTFVTLFGGNRLNLAVLLDISNNEKQRVQQLKQHKHLSESSVIEITDFISDKQEADIEDVFDPSFYLELVNAVYADKLTKALTIESLSQGPRIVKRVEKYFVDHNISGGKFNHYLPAEYLFREQGNLLNKINTATLQSANALFERLNAILDGSQASAKKNLKTASMLASAAMLDA